MFYLLQKEALFPKETCGARLRRFGRWLEGLRRPDVRRDGADARQALDQGGVNFLRSRWRLGWFGGVFRFRFVHSVRRTSAHYSIAVERAVAYGDPSPLVAGITLVDHR